MQVKTHIMQNKQGLWFLHITVSFHAYLFIFTHDETLLIFLLSLTYPFHAYKWSWNSNNIHGSIHIWVTTHLGEISRCLARHLPQVFTCSLPLINYIALSFTDVTLWQSMPFSYRKQTSGEKKWLSCGGILVFALHCIGSNLSVITRHTWPSWMALRHGGGQKLCHDIAFLLVLAEEEVTGDRVYGLSTIWVNPSQARVPSMEETVGKLTTCTFSGPNWPYALVWLHKGTHHLPLPKKGHMGILPLREAEVTPCRQISQLEVCQLLITSLKLFTP